MEESKKELEELINELSEMIIRHINKTKIIKGEEK